MKYLVANKHVVLFFVTSTQYEQTSTMLETIFEGISTNYVFVCWILSLLLDASATLSTRRAHTQLSTHKNTFIGLSIEPNGHLQRDLRGGYLCAPRQFLVQSWTIGVKLVAGHAQRMRGER